MKTALMWAVSEKNTLQYISGYSPNQLVFWSNFILTFVNSGAPAAVNTTTSSDLVRENFNALHKARENSVCKIRIF